ncbi:MAG TPA: GNAT family N-acetyltransferase [Thermomonas sp.]|jgi:predicted GNAT family acetyltransferase|nr:GNAT family N-acetyltransferase [Thermomonas sp.]
MTAIRHDAAHQRFVTEVDGHTAYVEYEPGDTALAITHTIVPKAIGGRGIAGDLVRAVMLHARAEGLRVDPQCSYADAWMRKHPEFEGLRA